MSVKKDEDFHRIQMYSKLVRNLRDQVVAIGVNSDGYVLRVADNKDDLKSIVTNSRIRYVVFDGFNDNVCFDLKTGDVLSDVDVFNDSNVTNHCLTQLLKSGKDDINIVEKELIYGNRLTYRLEELLRNKGISTDLKPLQMDNANGRLPMFRVLTAYGVNTIFSATGQQMSFLTSIGYVKLHDTNRDMELEDLVSILNTVFNVGEDNLEKAILG